MLAFVIEKTMGVFNPGNGLNLDAEKRFNSMKKRKKYHGRSFWGANLFMGSMEKGKIEGWINFIGGGVF